MILRGAALVLALLVPLASLARGQAGDESSARVVRVPGVALFPRLQASIELDWSELAPAQRHSLAALVARVELDVAALEDVGTPNARAAWVRALDLALTDHVGEQLEEWQLVRGAQLKPHIRHVGAELKALAEHRVLTAARGRLFPAEDLASSALQTALAQREEDRYGAQRRYAAVAFGVLLRLREDEVDALEGHFVPLLAPVSGVESDTFKLSDVQPGWSAVLTEERVKRIKRMTKGKRVRSRSSGDELALGRGRYPEDDFVLEAIAVARARGWSDAAQERLVRLGAWLGRRQRRESIRRSALGSPRIARPAADPSQSALWVDYLALVEADEGGAPDAGPARLGEEALVDARAKLIESVLAHVAHLSPDQCARLAPALRRYTKNALRARPHGHNDVGFQALVDGLRLTPRTATKGRTSDARALCDALRDALSETQRRALCLDPLP